MGLEEIEALTSILAIIKNEGANDKSVING